MAVLAYWKYENYKTLVMPSRLYAFNSNQSRLHTATEIGEDLFVVTGIRRESGFEIYLLAHLIISRKIYEPHKNKYGAFRILADRKKSRYFSLHKEALTPALSKLTSIKHFNDYHIEKYAQSFQALRKLNEHDARILRRFANSLPGIES